jgi:hypothetical protein
MRQMHILPRERVSQSKAQAKLKTTLKLKLKAQPNLICQFNHKLRPDIGHEHRSQRSNGHSPDEQPFHDIRCYVHIKPASTAADSQPSLSPVD